MNLDDAHLLLQDPDASTDVLNLVARDFPQLHVDVARHPNAPESFLAWARVSGTEEVRAAVAARQAAPAKNKKAGLVIGLVVAGLVVIAMVIALVLRFFPPSNSVSGEPHVPTVATPTTGVPTTSSPTSALPTESVPPTTSEPPAETSQPPSDTGRSLTAAGAYDANPGPFHQVFVLPAGRIGCALTPESAICLTPEGFSGSFPKAPVNEFCTPGEPPHAVILYEGNPHWQCSSQIIFGSGLVDRYDGDKPRWGKSVGAPTMVYGNDGYSPGPAKAYVLSYGKKIKRGNIVCLSETTGVTCIDTTKKTGFKLAVEGVVWYK